mmetsp:Transcript_108117/g.170937  ORF Transcript_108117/g.170937 Transcript_108117/m.170937 type:complete len:473 (-) Transcript_108117:66-1484(-)
MEWTHRLSHQSKSSFSEDDSRKLDEARKDAMKEPVLAEDGESQRTRRIARLLSLEAALNDEAWLSTKAPPDPSGVVQYLALFRFAAESPWLWPHQVSSPQFHVRVSEHAEINEHTWYLVECSLRCPGSSIEWQTARRLCHFRELLYDHIKSQLADSYSLHFAGAHFAHRGGIVGTTSRLSTWFGALAACINSGAATPYVVALTLSFLDAPHLHAIDAVVRAAAARTAPARDSAKNGGLRSSFAKKGSRSLQHSKIGIKEIALATEHLQTSCKESDRIASIDPSIIGASEVLAPCDVDTARQSPVVVCEMLDPLDINMEIHDEYEYISWPFPNPVEEDFCQEGQVKSADLAKTHETANGHPDRMELPITAIDKPDDDIRRFAGGVSDMRFSETDGKVDTPVHSPADLEGMDDGTSCLVCDEGGMENPCRRQFSDGERLGGPHEPQRSFLATSPDEQTIVLPVEGPTEVSKCSL